MNAPNKFELAIRASGMTRSDAKKVIGLRSYQAISERLDNPLLFRLAELHALSTSMNKQGKEILKDAIAEIFLI